MTNTTANLGFIGVGNMAQAMIAAFIDSKKIKPEQIFATNRTPGKLLKVSEQFGIQACNTHEELLEKCQTVFLAVKPQDMVPALESISTLFGSHHLVLSMAAGFPMRRLKKLLPQVTQLVRIMPNVPARLQLGVTGYYVSSKGTASQTQIENLLSHLGLVVNVQEEEQFTALSVACSAGVGFILEIMQYWQEWLEEHSFSPELAKQMVVGTFLGTSRVAASLTQASLVDLQNRVVSKKGITSAGLNSMRELEIERLLRYSLEKSALRDREIGEELKD